MAEFKVIETQEEFDERIKERIERAERKVREEFKGWISPDEAKKIAEQNASKIESLNSAHSKELEKYAGYDEKFTAQANRIKELETNALKTKVANERHLPLDAVEFLHGDSEEAIVASADKLAKLSAPQFSGITRNTETGNDSSAWRELVRDLSQNG
jgi:hypothetical protein